MLLRKVRAMKSIMFRVSALKSPSLKNQRKKRFWVSLQINATDIHLCMPWHSICYTYMVIF